MGINEDEIEAMIRGPAARPDRSGSSRWWALAALAMSGLVVGIDITILVTACNGDAVTASGQAHLLMSVTQDASGGFHFDINGNLDNVKGVGMPSGSPYAITSWFHDSANGGSGATEMSSTGVFNVISNGSSPNFVATGILHVSVTPNGALNVTVSDLRARCIG